MWPIRIIIVSIRIISNVGCCRLLGYDYIESGKAKSSPVYRSMSPSGRLLCFLSHSRECLQPALSLIVSLCKTHLPVYWSLPVPDFQMFYSYPNPLPDQFPLIYLFYLVLWLFLSARFGRIRRHEEHIYTTLGKDAWYDAKRHSEIKIWIHYNFLLSTVYWDVFIL